MDIDDDDDCDENGNKRRRKLVKSFWLTKLPLVVLNWYGI